MKPAPTRRRTRWMGILAAIFMGLLAYRSITPVARTLLTGGSPSLEDTPLGVSPAALHPPPIPVPAVLVPPPEPPAPLVIPPPNMAATLSSSSPTAPLDTAPPPPPPPPPSSVTTTLVQQQPAQGSQGQTAPLTPPSRRMRAFVFTMDSLYGVIEAAGKGGPAGEIRVRTSLQAALEALGIECDVAGSDAEMESRVLPDGSLPHDLIIMDEWTLRAPGGQVRRFVLSRESDVFLLAFFGLRSSVFTGDFSLPMDHVLTAFPTSLGGVFLGWGRETHWAPREGQCGNFSKVTGATAAAAASVSYLTPCGSNSKEGGASGGGGGATVGSAWEGSVPLPPRSPRGVVWGKKSEYFEGKEGWLNAATSLAPLHVTSPPHAPLPPNPTFPITRHGPLSPGEWEGLLAGSAFFLGLGDPLLGPSAMDAIAAGCVYINPTFGEGAMGVRGELSAWGSQHPFLDKAVGMPYVCNAPLGDGNKLQECIRGALKVDLPPMELADFTVAAYRERVKKIFFKWGGGGGGSSQIVAPP